jgi:hypothetical protein
MLVRKTFSSDMYREILQGPLEFSGSRQKAARALTPGKTRTLSGLASEKTKRIFSPWRKQRDIENIEGKNRRRERANSVLLALSH